MNREKVPTKRETSLHASLKIWYAGAEGLMEQHVEGYIIDVVGLDELVEIQTGNFGSLRRKLDALLVKHVVRVVYPVAIERWILRIASTGEVIRRRKSPKEGEAIEIFNELTSLHGIVAHPNLRLEVVLIGEEQVWQDDGRGSWRRKYWSLADRRLVSVVGREVFSKPSDYERLLPAGLSETFTTADLAKSLKRTQNKNHNLRLVGRMARALRAMGVIQIVGKRGSAYLYQKTTLAQLSTGC